MDSSTMTAWVIAPVALPTFCITGMCIVYAMALSNGHVCPVSNWVYNRSCEKEIPKQSAPIACCTLDHIPLVSKCGTVPPESCLFGLICTLGSFMVILVGLLRYAQVMETYLQSVLNTAGLFSGWICAIGLIIIGNFQVDEVKILHYIGAGMAFPTSMLFVVLQLALTYRMAQKKHEYWIGHIRFFITILAFITLVFSGVLFIQESFELQHAAAICEWAFIITILLFYGTFAFDFGTISTDTFLLMLKTNQVCKSFRSESSMVSSRHVNSNSENIAMI
ncbi:transmembrane protein 150A-like [Protopterus annectens]|uniref:transmembrane protein 150A-like n=1 Tax=Protopterus annectens TaxID=7888 RepID=UPI001CF98A67|nr:transmembrane protein 150A-like [Protopterus annectens]